jgi:hypothetical protein
MEFRGTEAAEEWDRLTAQRASELASGAVAGTALEDALAQLRARFRG